MNGRQSYLFFVVITIFLSFTQNVFSDPPAVRVRPTTGVKPAEPTRPVDVMKWVKDRKIDPATMREALKEMDRDLVRTRGYEDRLSDIEKDLKEGDPTVKAKRAEELVEMRREIVGSIPAGDKQNLVLTTFGLKTPDVKASDADYRVEFRATFGREMAKPTELGMVAESKSPTGVKRITPPSVAATVPISTSATGEAPVSNPAVKPGYKLEGEAGKKFDEVTDAYNRLTAEHPRNTVYAAGWAKTQPVAEKIIKGSPDKAGRPLDPSIAEREAVMVFSAVHARLMGKASANTHLAVDALIDQMAEPGTSTATRRVNYALFSPLIDASTRGFAKKLPADYPEKERLLDLLKEKADLLSKIDCLKPGKEGEENLRKDVTAEMEKLLALDIEIAKHELRARAKAEKNPNLLKSLAEFEEAEWETEAKVQEERISKILQERAKMTKEEADAEAREYVKLCASCATKGVCPNPNVAGGNPGMRPSGVNPSAVHPVRPTTGTPVLQR